MVSGEVEKSSGCNEHCIMFPLQRPKAQKRVLTYGILHYNIRSWKCALRRCHSPCLCCKHKQPSFAWMQNLISSLNTKEHRLVPQVITSSYTTTGDVHNLTIDMYAYSSTANKQFPNSLCWHFLGPHLQWSVLVPLQYTAIGEHLY